MKRQQMKGGTCRKACVFLSMSVLIFLLSACTTDAYEKGTGRYSLMHTDMAEVTTDSEKLAVSFVTDDGDSLALAQAFAAPWFLTGDTIYRAIVYYNKNDDGTAEAKNISSVPTLKPREHWRFLRQPQDPVGMESAWMGHQGKYLNMGLLIRSGKTTDSTAIHKLALAQDTIYTHANAKRTAVYRILHDQGGVPEYYTDRYFMSILLPARLDTVELHVQTYDGPLVRRFAVR